MTTVIERLKKALPLLGLLIALALPLMFVLEDFIRDAIVLPLAYLTWLLGVILDALPQALFVSSVIIVGIYVALSSLRRQREETRKPQPTYHQSEGAVALWAERISRIAEGAYSRERLDYYLGQLLTRTIAHEEHLSPREILSAVDSGILNLPTEIRTRIDRAYRRGYPNQPRWYQRILTRLVRLFTADRAHEATPRQLELELEPTLSYIEHRLRIEHTEVTSEPDI